MIVETFLRNELAQPLVERRDHSYDIRQILWEVNHILREEKTFERCPGRQLMLATVPGVPNPSHYGCGDVNDPFASKNEITPELFSSFNPLYRGYYLEGIWKTFPYRIGRMSLQFLPQHGCLAVTTGGRDRLVYAIYSEKNVYHLFDNHATWYHVPVDEYLYYIKGDAKHTLYNGTNEWAVYMVFELI